MKKIFVLIAIMLFVVGCCRTAEVRYSEEEAAQQQAQQQASPLDEAK